MSNETYDDHAEMPSHKDYIKLQLLNKSKEQTENKGAIISSSNLI